MNFLIPPWRHQLEAIARAEPRAHFALFMEMGTGKTSTAINILRTRYQKAGRLLRTFILCPPIVIENWKREFLAHSKIPAKDIVLLTGSQQERLEILETRCWFDDNPLGKVVVTNYEGLLMEDLFDKIASWRPEALVADESHKCKDPRSQRAKLTTQLADHADFKLILTGTPVLNSPMDLFSQYLILDGGQTFGRNYFAFRAKYFYDKNAQMPRGRYFPLWTIKPGSLEALNKSVADTSMRVMKSECLDLPPLVRQTRYVPMSPEQKRMYDEMKKDLITYVRGEAAVATLAITKALRLQQIVSGFVGLENEPDPSGEVPKARRIARMKENPRADALKELLEELTPHSKVLVWAVFKENYETIKKICEELKIKYVEVHGEISAFRKQKNVDEFNTDADCRVFLGHPGSGGIGINLVAASYSIFYSRSFSLEQDLQAEARNYRGGSEVHEKVTRIDLVCPQTIDEAVLKRLAGKQEIGDKILREIVEELDEPIFERKLAPYLWETKP